MGCLIVFFGCLEQSFPEGIIKPYEGTILSSGKVCCVQYLLVFRLLSGYTGERLIPGLRRKDWVLRALLLAVTSLWPQKLGSRDEIYSERWKLALISDQAKDLAKIVWKAGAVCLTAGFRSFTSGILSKSTVSIEKSFHVTNDLCRESESFTE